MKIASIIAEYNPIHNGHIYHIEETKKNLNCDALICIMSGNFMQRGEPSIIDKWTRAKMALLNSVDLVLELPTIYAVSSAEFFAFGAVSLLDSLNLVSHLSFGSESGNLPLTFEVAELLINETSKFKETIKSYLNLGLPYYIAREKTLKDLSSLDIDNFLSNPNNILAIEYCKNIIKFGNKISPFTIKRNGDNYNNKDIKSNFPSATAIRKFLYDNKDLHSLVNFLPKSAFTEIVSLVNNNYDFAFKEKLLPFLKYKTLSYGNHIENIPDASEGLHNKIFQAIINSATVEDIITKSKSKRYSYTRISRILCQYFLGFDAFNIADLRKKPCPYARVLGFNNVGRYVLKLLKESSNIPVYTKLPKSNLTSTCLKLDINATNVYSLINKNISPMADYITSPLYINEGNK